MSKYTPGPWGLSDEGTKYKIYGEKVKCSQFGELVTPIASTYFASNLDQANARLIAAAPEMLEALKVVESTDALRGMKHSGRDIMGLIKAAIAKAEGEN